VVLKQRILILFQYSALDFHLPAYEQTRGLFESFLLISELN
jgi:hypothetical protein